MDTFLAALLNAAELYMSKLRFDSLYDDHEINYEIANQQLAVLVKNMATDENRVQVKHILDDYQAIVNKRAKG